MEETSVRNVFITKEVAEKLNLSTQHVIRVGQKISLTEDEMREAGKRNYLFSLGAIEKIKEALSK